MIEFLMIVGAPTPVAPFSHATAADGWLFVTHPTDPQDDTAPLPAGIEAQTRRVLDNLQLVLGGAQSGLDEVVFARVYLTRFERDYAAMNLVYHSYFAPAICRRGPVSASRRSPAARLSRSICWRAERVCDVSQ